MVIEISDPDLEYRAQAAAAASGRTVQQVVTELLQSALPRAKRPGRPFSEAERVYRLERVLALGAEVAAMPTRDTRSDDEIIGYDEHGLPS